MYDSLETDLSRKELTAIFKESVGVPICLIGAGLPISMLMRNINEHLAKSI